MVTRLCTHCHHPFQTRPQVPHQTYCSSPACQKARRQRWQHDKLKNDPAYRENQKYAQRAWHDRHPEYWKNYRQSKPKNDIKLNTILQQVPINRQKTDIAVTPTQLCSGIYLIERMQNAAVAKSDAWIVRITPLCKDILCQKDACKYRT